MSKSFISICFLFVLVNGFSQEQKAALETISKKDTIIYKTSYGLRLGVDISRPIRGILQDSYNGFEIVGDYRISNRFYIAAEVGFEEQTTREDYTNSTAKGNYLKIGGNFNAYNNWLDMNNEVYLGFRYGFSLFEQTLNSYTPNIGNTYFLPEELTTPITTDNLTAHFTEFILGVKVETFKNLFVGFSFSYKIMLQVDQPENFKTLYAPGFNEILESDTGFGFNYTISYTIPFVKK